MVMARVLIAEDNETDRLLMGTILEGAGHEAYLAADGEEALSLYMRTTIDVVVTDIMMARKDGVELIMALKALNPDTPIIAVSGEGPTGLGFARLAGAQEIMTKPIDPDVLVGAVAEATRAGE